MARITWDELHMETWTAEARADDVWEQLVDLQDELASSLTVRQRRRLRELMRVATEAKRATGVVRFGLRSLLHEHGIEVGRPGGRR